MEHFLKTTISQSPHTLIQTTIPLDSTIVDQLLSPQGLKVLADLFKNKAISMREFLQIGMENILNYVLKPSQEEIKSVTGLEESLAGDFLKQMILLNKYMFTNTSTNNPEDATFQEMFVQGNLPLRSAILIEPALQKLGYNYSIYTIGHPSKVLKKHISKPIEESLVDYPDVLIPTEIIPFVAHLIVRAENPLVEMIIEDPVIKNRDLYSKLLVILREHADA